MKGQAIPPVYDDFYKYISGKCFYVNELVKRELGVDTWREYLREFVGYFTTDRKKGTAIDTIWDELRSLFLWLLPDTADPAEQLRAVFECMREARKERREEPEYWLGGIESMRTIIVMNIKGGSGKTTTTENMGVIIGNRYGKRVLLIDKDKQGNLSTAFGVKGKTPGIAELMLGEADIIQAIHKTDYENIDIIPADMNLLTANHQIEIGDMVQHDIIKRQLEKVKDMYDFCIIDCPPDINMSVINAIVAADEVIIPTKIDRYSFDGMEMLEAQLENAKEVNSKIKFRGVLITQYYRSKDGICEQGEQLLKDMRYPVFKTHIRRSVKNDASTFTTQAVAEYSPRCGAAQDYRAFVREYLEGLE